MAGPEPDPLASSLPVLSYTTTVPLPPVVSHAKRYRPASRTSSSVLYDATNPSAGTKGCTVSNLPSAKAAVGPNERTSAPPPANVTDQPGMRSTTGAAGVAG